MSHRNRTVLVIDDAEDCRDALALILDGMSGVVVRAVRSAEEALEVIAQEQVSMIITDMELPHMGGLELISQVRRDSTSSSVPIIVISGDTDPLTPARALSIGANAFFGKPYSPAAVRRKTKELIDAH